MTTTLPAPAPAPHPLIEAFLAPYAGRTRENYTADLRRWTRWCASREVDPLAPTRTDIEAWIGYLRGEQGLADNTARSYLVALAGLTRWLEQEGHLERDPMTHVRRPVAPRRSTRVWLTRTELAAVLDATAREPEPAIRAAVYLLALCGVRIGELVRADIADLGTHDGHTTLVLHGRKGGATDAISMPDVVGHAVADTTAGRTAGPLLLGPHTGRRIAHHAVRQGLRRALKRAGVTKNVTPHGLRATFITLALEAGVPERDVMASAGHASTVMVAHYDRLRGAIDRNASHRLHAWVRADA